jgi:hypothetical protein
MDEIPKVTPRASAPDSSKWIYRIVIAVILGEAIWSFLVSCTNDLVLPAIARIVGGIQFEFKVSNFLASIIELCLAGIVAMVLNSRSRKVRMAELKPAKRSSVVTIPPPVPASAAAAIIVPPTAPTSSAMATAAAAAPTATALKTPIAAPPRSPQPPAKPAQPKREKQVYYNIVGEPVDTDD